MNKYALIAAGGVAFVAVLIAAGWAYRYYIAPVRGAVEQREITNRGQYRIQAYEQFYRWQEELQAVEQKLGAYPESGLDKREQTECRGLVARRADIIAKYNAASRAIETQGRWQADDLPNSLPAPQARRCSGGE